MTTAHDTKRHSASRSGTSSSKHKHSRRKQDDRSRVVGTKLNQGLSVDTSEMLWTLIGCMSVKGGVCRYASCKSA